MGNFRGHAGPGTAFLLLGVPLCLRAMSGKQRWIQKMRTDKRWLAYEGLVKITAGILGFLLEGGDMVITSSYQASSHHQHLSILGAVAALGFVDVLCLFEWLREPFWLVLNPIGFAWIGIMFNVHKQETDFRIFSHTVNEGILLLISLSRFVECIISMHMNTGHFELVRRLRKEKREHDSEKKTSCFKFFKCSGIYQGVQVDVSPYFSNPITLSSVFPMLTGLLVCLDGMWWWQMAFSFYVWPHTEHENGHMAFVRAYQLIYIHIAIIVVTMILLSIILRYVDKKNGWIFVEQNPLNEMQPYDGIQMTDIEHSDEGQQGDREVKLRSMK